MNNQDILQYLKYQEKKVEGQLEALRMAISTIENAFNESPAPVASLKPESAKPSNENVQEVVTSQSAEEIAIPKTPKSKGPYVHNMMVHPSNDSKGKGTRPVKLGKNYQDNNSYTKKIAYLLWKEGDRGTQELVERIKVLEPSEPDTKVERSVAIGTSSMFRKGLIIARKDGRRYIYSLKDKNNA